MNLYYHYLDINSQDSAHLIQYNILNMGFLFQYMPCHITNMTLTGIIGNGW